MPLPGSNIDKIKLVLIEDQSMVRGALAALLALEPDFDLLDSFPDGDEALEFIDKHRVDVVVTDIEMPRMTGLELARTVQERGYTCKLVILTTFARSGYLRRAMDAGVQGYLLKDAPAEKLADAIRKVARGGKCIDPELIMESWESSDPLSNKERLALRHALAGQSTADIARTMCLSEGTIRNYLSEAMSKLHAKNRIEAARIAQQKGWL